ncbi:hypothetical protein [Nocardia sp. bgisy134]|uniref:hypothetical protein n=1 Tax=Nocardia sp. bgisy134 TaxID=3413789 RepID=UPI003D75A3F3
MTGTDPTYINSMEHFESIPHEEIYAKTQQIDAGEILRASVTWLEVAAALATSMPLTRGGADRVMNGMEWEGAAASAAYASTRSFASSVDELSAVMGQVGARLGGVAAAAEAVKLAVVPPGSSGPIGAIAQLLEAANVIDAQMAQEALRQEAVLAMNMVYKPAYTMAGNGVPALPEPPVLSAVPDAGVIPQSSNGSAGYGAPGSEAPEGTESVPPESDSQPEPPIDSVPDPSAPESRTPTPDAPPSQDVPPPTQEAPAPPTTEAPPPTQDVPPPTQEAPAPPTTEAPPPTQDTPPPTQDIPAPPTQDAPAPTQEAPAPPPTLDAPPTQETPAPPTQNPPSPTQEAPVPPPIHEPPTQDVPPPTQEAPAPPPTQAPPTLDTPPPAQEPPAPQAPPTQDIPAPPPTQAPPPQEPPAPPTQQAPPPPHHTPAPPPTQEAPPPPAPPSGETQPLPDLGGQPGVTGPIPEAQNQGSSHTDQPGVVPQSGATS